jgi:hypothetical protein
MQILTSVTFGCIALAIYTECFLIWYACWILWRVTPRLLCLLCCYTEWYLCFALAIDTEFHLGCNVYGVLCRVLLR